MFSLCVSTYLSITLIGNALQKLDENAIIVSFDERQTPISAVPFPAITICPEIKAERDKLNYTSAYNLVQEAVNRQSKKFPYGLPGNT